MCNLCGNPAHLHFDLGLSRPPSPAPSISTSQGIAAALGALDKGADLSPVAKTLAQLEGDRRHRIEKDLAGLADLELLSGAKGRRFVIAHWYENAAYVTQGIEYPRASKGELFYTVFIQEARYPLRSQHSSMADLHERLDEHKIPYHLAYFDK